MASFKGELCRCHRICSTEALAKQEIKFTIDLFEDNGHDRQQLENIANTYKPPDQQKSKKPTKNHPSQKPTQIEQEMLNLFAELPFQGEVHTDEEFKPFACIRYIPEIAPQIKRILTKAGVNTIFTAAPKQSVCIRYRLM